MSDNGLGTAVIDYGQYDKQTVSPGMATTHPIIVATGIAVGESQRDIFIKRLQSNIDSAMALIRVKTQDYATMDDPYRNFRLTENLGVTLEQGILVRMGDKMSRIANLIKVGNPAVKDESIEDTLLDLMNYANILLSYLQTTKSKGGIYASA